VYIWLLKDFLEVQRTFKLRSEVLLVCESAVEKVWEPLVKNEARVTYRAALHAVLKAHSEQPIENMETKQLTETQIGKQ